MGDDSEWLKLPAEEKCQHKTWKARLAGYEEVTKIFSQQTDPKSPEFQRYAGLMKKFVTDSNAVAQEKALDAVLAFVENAAVASRVCADVVSGVIAKCLGAPKQKTKDKGIEIVLMFVEIEKPDVVQECLLQGTENKNPKIVVGSIQILRMALHEFGYKVMPIKPVMKILPKLLEDRDKNIREETKQLVIEIYRWIGNAIKPQMSHFKPVQVTELEGEFEKLGNEKAQQQRFMRSQQDLKAKMEEAAATGGEEGGDDGGEEEEEAIDPYELMPSVDILKQLPSDFFDKIEAKKWQERKEALDALLKLVENPKIENGDFGPLVKCISKVIAKDTNVILVGIASKCLTGLAIGLRKKFSPHALNCIQMILDKFKEKKPTVVTALRDASDAIYPSTTLEAISEDVVAALDNKNPQIKTETASFLSRCFAKCTTATLPKKMLKMFCTALLKTINDTTPEVREASYAALGMAMRVVTEKNIMPFLPDVDSIKMQKIKESCDKAVLLNAKGEPRSGGGGGGASKPAPTKAPEPKAVAKPKSTAKPDQRPKTAPKKSTQKKDTKGKGGGKKGGAAAGELPTESVLSDEAVEDKAGAVFPGDTLKQLTSANWKDRLAAMENITQTMKGMSKDEIPCQAVVKTVAKKPGLKDNNFQVLKLRIELITILAKNAKFTKVSAECVLSDLIDKIGDVKQGKSVQECLSCIAEATSLEFICKEVIPLGFENKNPKNTAETLVWLAQAVKDFGLKLSVKPLITYIKKAFAATNPAVRASAITVTSVIYMYMGQQFRMFFEDEKPALLQQIDAEFEKVKGEKPPAPTRGVVAGAEGEEEEEDDEDTPKEEVNMADLIDRNDIGEKFTPELMESLVDKNWKIRKEALEKISAILNEAKFITGNLGSLPEGLKVRLGDNNKVLVGLTIGICVTLATNMGPHCKAHVKTIGPALLGCFGDMKPLLRQQAVNALTLWTDQTSLIPLVECEALSDTLKMENPNLRIELLGWLTEKLPDHKKLPVEFKMCIPHLLSCLEDRNGDVRKKAQDAVVPFMIHTGYDSVFKATSKLKPASKDQIMAIIEKARGNLPAKPVKAKKAASSSAVSKPVKDDYDEPEPVKSRPVSAALSDSGDSKPAKTTKAKGKAAPPPATSKKKKADEDTGPLMTLTVTKEQRFKEEKALKVLKWNFIELRGEFIEQLRTQMEKNFTKTIIDQMFQSDFKLHIKAIESLMKCINTLHDETVGNLDLILKWFTIRFFDTNPSMLNKAMEYVREVFTMLSDEDYHLVELEASSFIPYLIIKVGENKDNVRREVRSIFKLICKVYPASKMFTYLIDGLKSKNSKQRMECLEELGSLIESHGINICQPTPAQALKTIAGNIGDKDNGVRNAALNTTVVAYMILQDKLFKYISLKEKDQSMLDERIKRAMKNKPAQAAVEERPRTAPQPQKAPSQSNMQRPNTAMPKSASSNSVKKEFALEVDDDQMSQPEMPKLYQYDLDELFQPVSLPSAGNRARPASPMRNMNSHDASAAVAMVISQITTSDITMCIQALTQIDEVLKDEEKAEVLSNHVDQLLLSMSMQIKMVYSTHMSSEFTSKDDVTRLYRCLLGTLLAIFQNSSLAKKASKDVLKDLVNSLITILLDNRLTSLEEGAQVIRTVNVMVVKIVEHADHTSVLSALIRLLQDCVTSETCTVKFIELIMKCVWKMIRMLPDIINDLNLDRILLDTHLFLKEFPSTSWKNRPSDLPLRTVKTVLHSLVKLKGAKIIQHMGSIESAENSEVKAYLQKILHNDPNAKNEWNEEQKTPRSTQKPKKLNKNTHDILAEIFKKIGSKENTREGLNDLYDFKKKYPDADLEPFLKKSSNFFQNYIERGLKNIEQEREGKVSSDFGVSVRSDNLQSTNDSSVGHQEKQQVDYYRERLKILRAKCGLDNEAKLDTDITPEITKPPSPEPEIQVEIRAPEIETDQTMPRSTSTTDVSELKQRLERIKKLAKS
ncbi:cytoskeleton-associated protein 5-like [Mytilus californianus]|uniref:cytoskeleton-associated protein 5-like n=1 Tax=Mytilus californianus TaxID=6549 RepID=UPI0022454235|nr:cytoskeleton-associated protein 5-like [Mytilus californianus]